MQTLLKEIERVLPDGGDWCDLGKAQTLAAIVIALRPRIVVEIGVWMGGSLVPMLLAMKHVGAGRAIAIDPWSPSASVEGQNETNAAWWNGVDHERAYRKFLARLELHGLVHLCTICHRSSDLCEPPSEIQLLHIDGNHGPQAITDVERFASRVTLGGILVLDDIGWEGGNVHRAERRAQELGFRELYSLSTKQCERQGVVMQRRGIGE